MNGRAIVTEVREKGVDVLVALRTIREILDPQNRLVIIASTDSDLAPVLDEATELRKASPQTAKIETVSWWAPNSRNQQLRGETPVWNTRLNEDHFVAARDLTDYWSR